MCFYLLNTYNCFSCNHVVFAFVYYISFSTYTYNCIEICRAVRYNYVFVHTNFTNIDPFTWSPSVSTDMTTHKLTMIYTHHTHKQTKKLSLLISAKMPVVSIEVCNECFIKLQKYFPDKHITIPILHI